jgi:GGDEF domain-containing protein
MLITLEGYGQVSRAYGTIRAEDTLRSAAELVRRSIRKADILTRYDDCTFGLVLPHTGPTVAAAAGRLERVLSAWLADSGLVDGRAPVRIRIGYAAYPTEADDGQNLVALAAESVASIGAAPAGALAA